jgi:hypothetical protein
MICYPLINSTSLTCTWSAPKKHEFWAVLGTTICQSTNPSVCMRHSINVRWWPSETLPLAGRNHRQGKTMHQVQLIRWYLSTELHYVTAHKKVILILSWFMGDYRRGMDWWMPLLAQLGNTYNYSAIADLHTFQITIASAKPFPSCCVFNNRCLATASNSGDSSAPRAQVLWSQLPVRNSCQFPQSQLTTANCQLSTPELDWPCL